MCVIETKTYSYSDGHQRTFETIRRCHRAVGSRLCNRVDRRSTQQAQIVEARPTTAESPSGEGVIITEGRDGLQRVYRDLSKRSSHSSSVRRSNAPSERSSVSPPSSASSPAYVEAKPSASTLPPATPWFPLMERTRAPYGPPISPPEPTRIVTAEGTAIYERPPSLELPRAPNNERPPVSLKRRSSSDSSMKAEVDATDEPAPCRRRRRLSISIDTTMQPSTSSSPSMESPGLSSLPRVGSLRRDSRKAPYRADARKDDRARADSVRDSRSEQDRRLIQEEERQARLERDRLAESDRRQSAREELAQEASRERHRQAAVEALEGQQQRPREDTDPFQAQRDAEFAQMARERAAAAARRRESTERYAEDQLRRDPDARAYYETARISARPPSRRLTGEYVPSPLSARSSLTYPPPPPPVVHQYPSARRRGSSIRERGEEVIAREQARAATERLKSAMGSLGVEDDDDQHRLVDEYYIDREDQERRRRRRERRPQQFWR
ncbi:hypothetical protein LTR37_013219 [Vermiconidia calcicola]|uniref:Uncharacterized protein n=1 Tax=Vermiconidia calcicola TaxID=1690605 RepID=A0ACC3MY73_9PEZI|nr:hypothetical protein LTR37_013219 [Vermiconidia calcicola]